MSNNLCELESKINVKFKNIELLKEALTHSSYANENLTTCNERLEFLGDAVLELCMSKYLFSNNKNVNEGEMTKRRAQCVREEALFIYAKYLDLAKYLLLGNGEESQGGRQRPAIIADAFEALLGAIFQEFGFDKTYEIFSEIVLPRIDEALVILDYKSMFQELVQADKRSVSYEIISRVGPSHNSTFEAVVLMDDLIMGRGFGKSKKEAEQNAAKEALKKRANK